jgi:ornithine decarboxylase
VDYIPLDQIEGRITSTLALIYPPGIGVIVPRAFQESFNRFPGFNYEVQGVYQERVEGRIKFFTYVVRESDSRRPPKKGGDRARS